MAELKTRPTDQSVADFLDTVEPESKRRRGWMVGHQRCTHLYSVIGEYFEGFHLRSDIVIWIECDIGW